MKLCVTVDLDRDANLLLPGIREAGSIDRGEGTSPRYSSSARGLALLTDLFDDMNLPATFFAECQTLENLHDCRGCLDGFEVGVHGYAHEDFTLMDLGTAEQVLERSCGTVRDITGRGPMSFRFPYMRTSPELLGILPGYGIRVDSSLYSPAGLCRPYRIAGSLTELPVLLDPGSGRTSYLWPAHEGKRDYRSFVSLAESVGKDGTFVLCDHAWHICESRAKGVRPEAETASIVAELRGLLESLLDRGSTPLTVSDAARF